MNPSPSVFTPSPLSARVVTSRSNSGVCILYTRGEETRPYNLVPGPQDVSGRNHSYYPLAASINVQIR